MELNRVESFSDGVIAVIITIMVLELKVPADGSLASLEKVLAPFLAYVLSFVTVGIMWANHHHLLKAAVRPDSRLLWINNNLLFWMSLVPFVTAYMAANPRQPLPVLLYGVVATFMGLGFGFLRRAILCQHHGPGEELSPKQKRLLWKNYLSALIYLGAGALGYVHVTVAYVIYAGIALAYFRPDRSIVEMAQDKKAKAHQY